MNKVGFRNLGTEHKNEEVERKFEKLERKRKIIMNVSNRH
jgi:hypothetical protein